MHLSTIASNMPFTQTPERQEIEGNPRQSPEGDPNPAIGVSGGPNAERSSGSQLTEPSYQSISTVRTAILLCFIIAGNCLCSCFICLCLWGFSKIEDLTRWEKRAFNALSLLLSGALGFGIGFLLNQIGLLARGTLLQSQSHSVKEIGYIMMGTLSSYALLFTHQVRTQRCFASPTTWILFLFLLFSVFGRFGVAFLGFAFTLEDTPLYTPALFRPNWANGTINGGSSHYMVWPSIPEAPDQSNAQALLSTWVATGTLCEVAQAAKGVPWLEDDSAWDVAAKANNDKDNQRAIVTMMDISYFANDNLTMNVLDGNKVSFRYKFKDFRGTTSVSSGWEAVLETSCRSLKGTEQLPKTTNFTKFPPVKLSYRWIFPQNYHSFVVRTETVPIWLAAVDDDRRLLIFKCSLNFVDLATGSRPVLALDVHDDPAYPERQFLTETELSAYQPLSEVRLIGQSIHDALRQSPALSAAGASYKTDYADIETFRDFEPPNMFQYAVSRRYQDASELWLSAYLGNYIGNCLSFLNDILERVVIEPEVKGINTKLSVKWQRVAATLGGLAGFQVLVGLTVLWYCRRSFEIVDGVPTLSYMFTDFPFGSEEERRQEGAVHQGRFVPEGGGFRWVLLPETGPEIKTV
ncbi:hypothetical protein EV426DRAFT_601855 [Tirmania nivea]|nr:hypothetical protein EV426DRAFT_601855 [Tirmania nivea]